METFKEYLKESRGGEVYYWHREYNVSLKLLSDNEIRLTDSRFKGSEVLDKKRPFFMSMSRVPVNRWRKGMSGVVFEFDGRKLSADYKIVPFNYWGGNMRVGDWSESEDRLISDKKYIPNMLRYVRRIHILADENINFITLLKILNVQEIDVLIYRNKKDFLRLRNGVNIADYISEMGDDFEKNDAWYNNFRNINGDDHQIKDVKALVSLYKNNVNYKTKYEKMWAERAIYSPRDFINQIDSVLHSSVSSHYPRVEMYKTMISDIMDANGVSGVGEFALFMMNFIRKKMGKNELKPSDFNY